MSPHLNTYTSGAAVLDGRANLASSPHPSVDAPPSADSNTEGGSTASIGLSRFSGAETRGTYAEILIAVSI